MEAGSRDGEAQRAEIELVPSAGRGTGARRRMRGKASAHQAGQAVTITLGSPTDFVIFADR
eukprot:11276124-Karenia_brevis.AAC.1